MASPSGDADAAFQLLMLLEDTYEGIVKPYDPDTKLLGAVNKDRVTCYLDALLFAMFARLESFEAMLYENFADPKRKRLAGLLRLWLNLLRSGRLVTPDITGHLQKALAACGWEDAASNKQQDPSEAFTFITEQLELPMLTLKMDMYHTGKEEPHDDHKFVNERLLEVAIPDEPMEGRDVIMLEDCLELYFNNRIEVKRHLENQRRNTVESPQADGDELEKECGSHIEVAEVSETPLATPLATPLDTNPVGSASPLGPSKNAISRLRPSLGRKRQDSIFSQRRIHNGVDPRKQSNGTKTSADEAASQQLSTRTEVLMPAWQFFRLLPWYTEHMPTSDAQVAAHFSRQRPVLGICLKRYSYTATGQARKLETYVDIPLEMAVPDFVSDESMQDEGPAVGNFRLVLQAAVCHRGMAVNSGHYVCICRGRSSLRTARSQEQQQSVDGDDCGFILGEEDEYLEDPWLKFDDLAPERVTPVANVQHALKNGPETPYLLFYQVQPIGEDHDLPSYTEATSRTPSEAQLLVEKPSPRDSLSEAGSEESEQHVPRHSASDPLPVVAARTDFQTNDSAHLPHSEHASSEHLSSGDAKGMTSDTSLQSVQHSNSTSMGRGSWGTAPTTLSIPNNSSGGQVSTAKAGGITSGSFLNVARQISGSTRRSNKNSAKTAGVGDKLTSATSTLQTGVADAGTSNRFSLNMSKFTQRMSGGKSLSASSPTTAAPDATESTASLPNTNHIHPSEHVTADLAVEKDAQDAPPQSTVIAENAADMNGAEHGYNEGMGARSLTRKEQDKVAKGGSIGRRIGRSKTNNGTTEDRECITM